MNWDAIGAIGEIVGAFAVVLTLAYLAVQIRISRIATLDSNRLTRASGVREAALSITNNDSLLDTLVTTYGCESYFQSYAEEFGIDVREAIRLDFMHQHYFWLHWGQYASLHDPKDVNELKHLIRKYYAVPAVKYSWDHSPLNKPMLDPEFTRFVDAVLAENAGK